MGQLPFELVLEVIDSVVSGSACHRIAYPARHWRTKTLLAFTRVSRATYANARRSLYQHCVYLDSQTRLRQLLRTLTGPEDSDSERHQLYQHHLETRSLITALYLSPFPGPGIDDLPIAQWTFQLLSTLQNNLRRLVIDIDFRSLSPWNDHLDVIPTLRAGFEELRSLEEFTSVRSELHLEPRMWMALRPNPIWTMWPNITKLSLYGAAMSSLAPQDSVLQLPDRLTHLVLTRPSAFEAVDFRRRVFARTATELRVLVLDENAARDHQRAVSRREMYRLTGLDEGLPIDIVWASLPGGSDADTMSSAARAEAYQAWTRDEAIKGSLWYLNGLLLDGRRSQMASLPTPGLD